MKSLIQTMLAILSILLLLTACQKENTQPILLTDTDSHAKRDLKLNLGTTIATEYKGAIKLMSVNNDLYLFTDIRSNNKNVFFKLQDGANGNVIESYYPEAKMKLIGGNLKISVNGNSEKLLLTIEGSSLANSLLYANVYQGTGLISYKGQINLDRHPPSATGKDSVIILDQVDLDEQAACDCIPTSVTNASCNTGGVNAIGCSASKNSNQFACKTTCQVGWFACCGN